MALPIDKEQGFGIYYHGFSTAGIFFRHHNNGINDTAEIYSLYHQFYPHLLVKPYHPFPQSFTVLSSSKGHILCRTSRSSYFIMYPNFRTLFIPNPQKLHHRSTTAVISFNFDHSFNISCAIYEGGDIYTFDIYHSKYGWRTRTCQIHIIAPFGRICLNTGVALYRYAYWLTEGPVQTCIMCDPINGTVEFKDKNFPIIRDPSKAKLQLGRIKDHICVVVVNSPYGSFFVLKDNRKWKRFRTISLVGGFEYNSEVVPLRFESYKFEFVFCVGGVRLGMIESSDMNGKLLREVELSFSEQILAANDYDIGNAVPFAP